MTEIYPPATPEWAERMAQAQLDTHVLVNGHAYPRLAYGPDSPGLNLRARCYGCYVLIGQRHVIGCMHERCAICGEQAYGCPCLTDSEVVTAQ